MHFVQIVKVGMRTVKQIDTDYCVVQNDEYTDLLVDCSAGQVVIQLPYANEFREIKITKVDDSKSNCVIKVRGLDKFATQDSFLSLEEVGDFVLLQSDNEELWKIVSFSKTFMDETFVEELEENFVVMLPPELPTRKEKLRKLPPGVYLIGLGTLIGVGTLIAWMLS